MNSLNDTHTLTRQQRKHCDGRFVAIAVRVCCISLNAIRRLVWLGFCTRAVHCVRVRKTIEICFFCIGVFLSSCHTITKASVYTVAFSLFPAIHSALLCLIFSHFTLCVYGVCAIESSLVRVWTRFYKYRQQNIPKNWATRKRHHPWLLAKWRYICVYARIKNVELNTIEK